MSGVNGGVKLNITTPKISVAETEKPVSALAMPKNEPKKEEKPKIKVEKPEVKAEVVKTQPLKPVEEIVVKHEKVYNVKNILNAYNSLEESIKSLYDNVFSKTPDFKPTYTQTVADTFNYIFSLLVTSKLDGAFRKAFGLEKVECKNYANDYVPYSVKLSKWAEDKGLLNVVESVLTNITSLYIESAKECDAEIVESGVAETFSAIIDFAF
ncbi:MAG: hypothetical protein IKL82_02350 [Clostridia bacterium]|nr:hypothetical protein [Clostridia bacterium]